MLGLRGVLVARELPRVELHPVLLVGHEVEIAGDDDQGSGAPHVVPDLPRQRLALPSKGGLGVITRAVGREVRGDGAAGPRGEVANQDIQAAGVALELKHRKAPGVKDDPVRRGTHELVEEAVVQDDPDARPRRGPRSPPRAGVLDVHVRLDAAGRGVGLRQHQEVPGLQEAGGCPALASLACGPSHEVPLGVPANSVVVAGVLPERGCGRRRGRRCRRGSGRRWR